MRRITIYLFLLLSLCCMAQTAGLCFMSMPDQLCPYIDRHQREYMLIMYGTTGKCVENPFGGVSCITDNTLNHLRIELTDSISYDILLENDSTWLLISTACAPVCSSVIKRYNGSWTNGVLVKMPIDAPFVKAEVVEGQVVYSNQTPLLRDDEENHNNVD